MSTQAQLAKFIDRLALPHFRGKEVADYANRTRGRVKNSVPPEAIWPNIIPTLIVANELREMMDVPLTITSAYRSPSYNTAVGGETGSYHMRFMALDLIPSNGNVKFLAECARKIRGHQFKVPGSNDSFVWMGGIGVYPNFVHIDCRGYNANW